MKKDLTIMLTGIGGPGAPGMIKCYKNNGERSIRIIGVDMNPNAAGKGLVDAFYVVPRAGSDNYISTILEICMTEHVEIIVPIVTRELLSFAENKSIFEQHGIKVSVMPKDQLLIVNDKGNLFEALRKKGLPTPQYSLVNTTNELFDAIRTLGYPHKPVCIKATSGNGSRGIRMLDLPENDYIRFFSEKPDSHYISYEYLEHIFSGKDIPRMMVMELLPGSEYSVDVVADDNGIRAMVCRRGLRVVSSIQVECVIEQNCAVEALCRSIIHSLNLVGQFGFDLKCDENGTPYVLEINPRLTAGIVACAVAGCNLPYLELLRLLDEEIPPIKIQYGTLMTRRWHEVFFDGSGNQIDW